LTIISLCPLPLDISLSALSPSDLFLCSLPLLISLCSFQISLLSLPGESREIGRGRERSERGREIRESLCVLRDDACENHDGEPSLGDDAGENHHDGEPPEIDLILLSSFSRRRQRGCRDGGEIAER